MELLADPQTWIAFATLTALELVLGIDNIIFIAILVDKLPPERREFARRLGLFMAMFMRIGLLLVLAWIVGLVEPLFTVVGQAISGRDLILIAGGLFLIWKSTGEAMRFDLTTLNLVLAIADTRSITRGAERETWRWRQPASACRTWKRGFGVPLFERRAAASSPPRPAARWCATSARCTPACMRWKAKWWSSRAASRATCASWPMPAPSANACRPTWRRFRRRTRIRISLEDLTSAEVQAAVAEGRADVGIFVPPLLDNRLTPAPTAKARWPRSWCRRAMRWRAAGAVRFDALLDFDIVGLHHGAAAHEQMRSAPRPGPAAEGAAAGARLRRHRAAGGSRPGRGRAAGRGGAALCPGLPRAAAGAAGAWAHDRQHPVRQALGRTRRPHRGRRHLPALHRPPPGARGDQPAGLRGPAPGRPQGLARQFRRRHRRPQHADHRLGRGLRRHHRPHQQAAGGPRWTPTSRPSARRRTSPSCTSARASCTSSARSTAPRCRA
jgi:hypothetical protein